MTIRFRSQVVLLVAATVLLALLAGAVQARPAMERVEQERPEHAQQPIRHGPPSFGEPMTVAGIEALGMVTYSTGFTFAGTEVGGLSGVAYDAARDVYYIISDAKGEEDEGPSRFYTLEIDVGDGSLDDGDVTFVDVTPLRQRGNRLFPVGASDAESIVLPRPGQLFISTEGATEDVPPIDPYIARFNPTGRQNRSLPIPDKFLAGGANSVRDNLGFESLTALPGGATLFAATENALAADGPVSTLTEMSPSRVLELKLAPMGAGSEFVYMVEPIPQDSDPPGGFADNGLVEMEALDGYGTFLAMERSFAVGVGNTIRLFETSTQGATDVSGLEVLGAPGTYEPMSKRLVADLETDLGIDPDNVEGMRFGPTLPDGRRLMILVSDNNFNPPQTTQIIALAVTLEPAGD